MDIDEILSRVNPKTAQAFKKASELEHELLATPSLGINRAIGGVGYGRQTLIWGNRSGGKTLFSLQLAASAQSDGKTVAWIDSEKNFDNKWAQRFGVNTDQLIVTTKTTIAEVTDYGHDLIRAGIDMLVIDSISTLLAQSYFDDGEMKDFEKTGQIGSFSKDMGKMASVFNDANEHTALVLISQVRNQIGSWGATLQPMGGKGIDHLNSTQIKLWSATTDKDTITDDVMVGNFITKIPIARPVTWTIDKNRGPGMNQSGKYDLYFAGDYVGVDIVGEIVDMAVAAGLIKKKGGWFEVGGHNIQGRPALVRHIREDVVLKDKLYGELIG